MVGSSDPKRMAAMHDFYRDWRRWTIAERIAAAMIASALIIGPSTLFALARLFT